MTDHDINQPSQQQKTSPWTTAINIFTSPGEAFAAINSHPTKLFPLLAILLSTALVMVWYFSMVDYGWYIDDTLSNMGHLSADELDQARKGMAAGSQTTSAIFGSVGAAIFILVMFCIQGGYLTLVSALSGDKYRFSHWFSLACWANLPSLLSVLGMAVNIMLSSNGQLSVTDLDALSLSSLGLQAGDNFMLQSLLQNINLTTFWSMALAVMAYRAWLNSSLLKALAVILGPFVVICGSWLFIALK